MEPVSFSQNIRGAPVDLTEQDGVWKVSRHPPATFARIVHVTKVTISAEDTTKTGLQTNGSKDDEVSIEAQQTPAPAGPNDPPTCMGLQTIPLRARGGPAPKGLPDEIFGWEESASPTAPSEALTGASFTLNILARKASHRWKTTK
jgi:hypothetical protein